MRLLIGGAGGHGRVVADAASLDPRWGEIAFLDDRYPVLEGASDWPVVGTMQSLARHVTRYDAFIPGVGDASLRLVALESAEALGFQCPVIVHPTAAVSRYAVLQAGCVVFATAAVNHGAALGRACIVNTGATVDHDCRLGDAVHVCPGAHIAGNVLVGRGAWIGIGAAVKQGITIGPGATVGAGAACIRDVAENATVVGVPAREIDR